jgi:hypothetical protein
MFDTDLMSHIEIDYSPYKGWYAHAIAVYGKRYELRVVDYGGHYITKVSVDEFQMNDHEQRTLQDWINYDCKSFVLNGAFNLETMHEASRAMLLADRVRRMAS